MVANFPPLSQTNTSVAATPTVSLGLGNDLDPKLLRWLVPGGIGGFLLWAIATQIGRAHV